MLSLFKQTEELFDITIYPFNFLEKPKEDSLSQITSLFKCMSQKQTIDLDNSGLDLIISGGITMKEFSEIIEKGFSFIPASFVNYTYVLKESESNNLKEAAFRLIIIDVDNIKDNPVSKESILKKMTKIDIKELNLTLEANFYYETFTSKNNCFKCRFVYGLNERYTKEKYSKILSVIKSSKKIQSLSEEFNLDTSCFNTSRIFHGSNKRSVFLSETKNVIDMNLVESKYEENKTSSKKWIITEESKKSITYQKKDNISIEKYKECNYIKEWIKLNKIFQNDPSKTIKKIYPLRRKDDHSFYNFDFIINKNKKTIKLNRPNNILRQQLLLIIGDEIKSLLNYIIDKPVETNLTEVFLKKSDLNYFCDNVCENKKKCPIKTKIVGKSNISNKNALTKEESYDKLTKVIDNFFEKNHKEPLHFLSVQTGVGKTKYLKEKLNTIRYKNHKIIVACDTHKLCEDYYNELPIRKLNYFPKFIQFNDVLEKHNLNVTQKELFKLFHNKNITNELRKDIRELMEKEIFIKSFLREIENNKTDLFLMTHHKLFDLSKTIKNSIIIIDELPKIAEIIQPKYDINDNIINEYELKKATKIHKIDEETNKEIIIYIKDNIDNIKKLIKNKNKILITSATIPFEETLKELFNPYTIKFTSIKTKNIGNIIQIPFKTTKDILNSQPYPVLNYMIDEINNKYKNNKIDFLLTTKKLTKDINLKNILCRYNTEMTDMYFYNNMGRNDFTGKNIIIFGSSYINLHNKLILNEYFKKYYGKTLNWGIENINDKESKKKYYYSDFIESQEMIQTIGRARVVQHDVNVYVVNDMYVYYNDIHNLNSIDEEEINFNYLNDVFFN